MNQVPTIALLGAGNRGKVYADYLLSHPQAGRLVALAEPNPARRSQVALAHGISDSGLFRDWRELLSSRLADGLIIATPDREHVEPALAALQLGYTVLLEKPLAPTLSELLRLAAAPGLERLAVAHVLRYTDFFGTVAQILNSGQIGELIAIEHHEDVGYWHFAHSYVRGNWRHEADSSPFILAKACHDLDLLRWYAGRPATRAVGFGELRYFKPASRPAGAPERCSDGCPAAPACPFEAQNFYLSFPEEPVWPASVISDQPTRAARAEALRTGPYGKCVFGGDNDVPDHYSATIEFGEVLAQLSVSAFTPRNTRQVRFLGTKGNLSGDLEAAWLEVTPYGKTPQRYQTGGQGQRHGGGDNGLMADFLARLQTGAPSPTGFWAALESHLLALALEESRHSGRVIELAQSPYQSPRPTSDSD